MVVTRRRNKPTPDAPLLLAFGGREKSGKSTSAGYVVNKYGGQTFAFADVLKSQVYDLAAIRGLELSDFLKYASEQGHDFDFHGLPKPNLNNPKRADKIAWINRHKADFGNILQIYGDFKRSDNPNYFLDKTLKQIETAISNGDYVLCVDDVRFINEADSLAAIGFSIVRVQTGDEKRAERGACRDATHPSESQMDSYNHDFIIDNSKDPHDLYPQIDKVVLEVINENE